MRAIKDLSTLEDEEFFAEISTGLKLIVEVVAELDEAAKRLSSPSFAHLTNPKADYPATILSAVGEEEAAKVLILIDAVRCPRSKSDRRTQTLKYFYDHLAKTIYAQTCNWHPANFAEVSRLIEVERDMYYLDGPTGADWLFRNQNIERRENALYVGYEKPDGDEFEQASWTSPLQGISRSHLVKGVFRVSRALHQIGLLKPDALAAVAKIWRPIEVCPLTSACEMKRWNELTLEELRKLGLLLDAPADACDAVINYWPPPLWSIDVGMPSKEETNRLKRTLLDKKSSFSEVI